MEEDKVKRSNQEEEKEEDGFETEEEEEAVVRAAGSNDSDSEDDEEDSEDSDYDSDDPENWGPYHWSENGNEDASIAKKAVDYVKFATFKSYRREVLAHFFGLHDSPYQWVLDSVEREREEEQERQKIEAQRAAYSQRLQT